MHQTSPSGAQVWMSIGSCLVLPVLQLLESVFLYDYFYKSVFLLHNCGFLEEQRLLFLRELADRAWGELCWAAARAAGHAPELAAGRGGRPQSACAWASPRRPQPAAHVWRPPRPPARRLLPVVSLGAPCPLCMCWEPWLDYLVCVCVWVVASAPPAVGLPAGAPLDSWASSPAHSSWRWTSAEKQVSSWVSEQLPQGPGSARCSWFSESTELRLRGRAVSKCGGWLGVFSHNLC